MPLLIYYCPVHGKFEKLLPSWKPTYECPECERKSEQVPAVPSKFVWGKSGSWT